MSNDTDIITNKKTLTKLFSKQTTVIDKSCQKNVKSGQSKIQKMIKIITDGSIPEINLKHLEQAISRNNLNNEIYKKEDVHQINLQLLPNKDIIKLNKEFRDKDYLPDVLSFDYRQEKMFDHELSGEIFISLEKAKTQALEKKHSLKEELLFLTIHGTLHVLGFDHKNDSQELEMKKFEDKINNSYKNLT
ncbi:rRNA maturation RNase YbeY [bacterium]|jgi:probable rRNA maturation factor|nr:rRNA maturation RNase YbeY [bacterium]MBT6293494.1 rRNA maturation RNase YbeY [bacterium]